MAVIVGPSSNGKEQAMQALQWWMNSQREEKAREEQQRIQQEQFNQQLALNKARTDADIAASQAGIRTSDAQTNYYGAQTTATTAKTIDDGAEPIATGLISTAQKNFPGDPAKAAEWVKSAMASIPNAELRDRVNQRVLALVTPRDVSDADITAANTSRYLAKETGVAASGSEDVQARNLATLLGAGQQLSGPAFANQEQQEAGPQDYARYLDINGGRAVDAKTAATIAAQKDMNDANNAAALRAATAKGGATAEAGTDYAGERQGRISDSIVSLLPRVGVNTVGPGGTLLSHVPGTDAYNFKSDLDKLKANIAFNELAQMRAASKTGGALGAVSEKEMKLLESALGSLDQGQSPEQMKKNLGTIAGSVQRWQAASGGGAKTLDASTAAQFLQQAGGDKNKARELARKAGFSF